MKTRTTKKQKNKSQAVANRISEQQSLDVVTSDFEDNRPETITQRKLQEIANNSPQAKKTAQFQAIANRHSNLNSQNTTAKESSQASDVIQFVRTTRPVVLQKKDGIFSKLFGKKKKKSTKELCEKVKNQKKPSKSLLSEAQAALKRDLTDQIADLGPLELIMKKMTKAWDKKGIDPEAKSGALDKMPGLANKPKVEEFTVDFKAKMEKAFSKKRTREEYKEKIYKACVKAANNALRKVGCPELYGCSAGGDDSVAAFQAFNWVIRYNEPILIDPILDALDKPARNQKIKTLARKTLHETRHCEQHYLYYQWLAGKSPIKKEEGRISYIKEKLPSKRVTKEESIIEDAAKNPIGKTDQATQERAVKLSKSLKGDYSGPVDENWRDMKKSYNEVNQTHRTNLDKKVFDSSKKDDKKQAKKIVEDAFSALTKLKVDWGEFKHFFNAYLACFHEKEARQVEQLFKHRVKF